MKKHKPTFVEMRDYKSKVSSVSNISDISNQGLSSGHSQPLSPNELNSPFPYHESLTKDEETILKEQEAVEIQELNKTYDTLSLKSSRLLFM